MYFVFTRIFAALIVEKQFLIVKISNYFTQRSTIQHHRKKELIDGRSSLSIYLFVCEHPLFTTTVAEIVPFLLKLQTSLSRTAAASDRTDIKARLH